VSEERDWNVVVSFGGMRTYRVRAKTKTEACNKVNAKCADVRFVGDAGKHETKAKFAIPVDATTGDRSDG
jgi:hypothetical protein